MATTFANVGEDRIALDIAGRGETILLIHAGVAHRGMWDPQFRKYAGRFQVIRYDLRGFGESDDPSETAFPMRDAVAVLDHVGAQRAHIMGISIGASIATEVAVHHPERVQSLVLGGPGLFGFAPSPDDPDQLKPRFEDAAARRARGDIAGAAEIQLQIWLAGPHRSMDRLDPHLVAWMREMLVRNYRHPATALDKLEAEQPSAATLLDRVHAPTLVLCGDEDTFQVQRTARHLAANIAGARYATMANAAHMLNMEHPQRWDEHVLPFLAETLARR